MPIQRIMIVDDNEAEHFLYKHAVRKFDPDIVLTAAYDGQEALDHIGETVATGGDLPDCILVDINMPRMGGVEFLEKFQERNPETDIVVVMLTSSMHPQDREAAMSYACVEGFFTKPLDQNDLAALADMVNKRKK